MSALVWLASYPKSGNTWVRALLANYLSGDDQPVDINKLGATSRMASARRLFDEWSGVEASSLDPVVVDGLRAEVYRCIAEEATTELFIKVHDSWGTDERGRPMFAPDVTRAVIYIVRNPLDVALSSASHWGVEPEEAVERMCDPGYTFGGTDSRLPDQLRQFMGCWSHHARSWLDDSALPAQLVRYEDLRHDPEGSLTAILKACRLSPEPVRVRRAAQFSDFAELQRQELAHGFGERPSRASGSFFRRGQVGLWRNELPAPLVTRLVGAHSDMMARLGYMEEVT
jgi:hypothetical protein